MDNDLAERVAVLESQRADDIRRFDELMGVVNGIHDDLTRYKGFIGAVAFLFSCVTTAAILGKSWIAAHWK